MEEGKSVEMSVRDEQKMVDIWLTNAEMGAALSC